MPRPATCSAFFLVSSTVAESPGQPGATGAYPASLKRSIQAPHESAWSQRPWTKTTGVPAAATSSWIQTGRRPGCAGERSAPDEPCGPHGEGESEHRPPRHVKHRVLRKPDGDATSANGNAYRREPQLAPALGEQPLIAAITSTRERASRLVSSPARSRSTYTWMWGRNICPCSQSRSRKPGQ